MKNNTIAIVTAPFYQDIIDGLYHGAENYLTDQGCEIVRIDVPGALEIPLACQLLAQSNKYQGIV